MLHESKVERKRREKTNTSKRLSKISLAYFMKGRNLSNIVSNAEELQYPST